MDVFIIRFHHYSISPTSRKIKNKGSGHFKLQLYEVVEILALHQYIKAYNIPQSFPSLHSLMDHYLFIFLFLLLANSLDELWKLGLSSIECLVLKAEKVSCTSSSKSSFKFRAGCFLFQ